MGDPHGDPQISHMDFLNGYLQKGTKSMWIGVLWAGLTGTKSMWIGVLWAGLLQVAMWIAHVRGKISWPARKVTEIPVVVRNLEGPTRKPRHATVFNTHSDTQAVPAFHCIRMFKGIF